MKLQIRMRYSSLIQDQEPLEGRRILINLEQTLNMMKLSQNHLSLQPPLILLQVKKRQREELKEDYYGLKEYRED